MTRRTPDHAAPWHRHALFSVAMTVVMISPQVAAQQAQPQANPSGTNGAEAQDGSGEAQNAEATRSTVAPTVNECVIAHHDSQSLRKDRHLLEALDLLKICRSEACPTPVKLECLRWAEEVTEQVPSVVFRLDTESAGPSRNVKIFINDELRFWVVPSRATELNPGLHRFRFVKEGKPSVEQEFLLDEGKKLRLVNIKFPKAKIAPDIQPPPPKAAPASQGPAPVSPPSKASTTVETRSVPIATYVFAGVGAAAVINFGVWGISSKALMSELDDTCAPYCEQKDVDRARFRATVADISLGVGLASLTAATVFYFLRPTVSAPVGIDVSVLPKGGVAATIRLKAF